MGNVTGERLTALAAVVATGIAAASGVTGAVVLTQWVVPNGVLTVGAVLAGVAAGTTAAAGWRTQDRALLALGVSVLAFALSWPAPGLATTVLVVVAQGALLAAGIRTTRSTRGTRRALGWIASVAAAAWFVGLLMLSTAPVLAALPQEALGVVLSLPYLFQCVGYLAALLLVAPPLLRPVAAGAARLWASAEVR
ncbi:hypothetical protein ACTJKO_10465 [Curtobacterium sp. 22159]|uniref:hypothetical protein n=1 Tax=Curtobacterium sp. 22159 TaxID=3453882 RepID=UPI003F875698